MSDETRGHAIRARRLGHGIKSVRAFAEASGVSRVAVTAAEAGEASTGTYDRLEAWLDRLEERDSATGEGIRRMSPTKTERALAGAEPETGISAHSPAQDTAPHIVVVRLKNHAGEVVVEGPVEDIATLEAAAQRLILGMAGPA
jgi:transcriptional regulator with XRE-family HTH domain